MSKTAGFCTFLLIALAGCSTAHRKGDAGRVPDWESPELPRPVEPVVVAPAPPPVIKPVSELPPGQTWGSFEHWARVNGLGEIRAVSLSPFRCVLETKDGLLTLEAGSHTARWNGVAIQLGFAPRLIGRELQVHALDVRHNFIPLLNPQPLPTTNRVIVIDPGHGGTNLGATNVFNGVHEKEFTLDWAQRLAPLLASNGWTVFLTRTNDTELTLAERVAFADACKADLFLSLHFNSSSPRQREAGLETYCLTPQGMPSNLTRGYEDDPAQVFPNNAFDALNFQYAVRLHRALLEVNGRNDRGVRRARFLGVLRGQARPAVLIEGGYLSNPEEARKIADPAHRQALAEAVARALR